MVGFNQWDSGVEGHLTSYAGSSAQRSGLDQIKRHVNRVQQYQWQEEVTTSEQGSMGTIKLGAASRDYATTLQSTTAFSQTASLASSNAALGAKMTETQGVQATLDETLAATLAEIESLKQQEAATEAALASKVAPIAAVKDWLSIRLQRPASEKLRDSVEISLNALLAALNESVALLTKTKAAQFSELSRLELAKASLEADLSDKEACLGVDGETLELTAPRPITPTTQKVMLGSMKAPYNPVQWRGSSRQICTNAKRVIAVASRLRAKSIELEKDAAAKEAKIHAELQQAHAACLALLKSTITASEAEIAGLATEIGAIDTEVQSNLAAAAAKEESAGVALSRLTLRTQRPNRELVLDGAQLALQSELAQMTFAASELNKSTARMQSSMASVDATKLACEADLANKKSFLELEQMCSTVSIPL